MPKKGRSGAASGAAEARDGGPGARGPAGWFAPHSKNERSAERHAWVPPSRGARDSAVLADEAKPEGGIASDGGEELRQAGIAGAKGFNPHEVAQEAEIGASRIGAQEGLVFFPEGVVAPVVSDLHAAPVSADVAGQSARVGRLRLVAAKIEPALGGRFTGTLVLDVGIDDEQLAHMRKADLVGLNL